ncbi:hypothetical protein J6W91_00065 [Candidatus Saccharibacteria bacterium]|nr:hypothetical protein [Candidatus Saccharibacteria bacterium]
MYDDTNLEKFPGQNPEAEQRGEYADVWEDANMMEDAPDFQGEDPFNPEAQEGQNPTEKKEIIETEKTAKYGGAGRLADYGLDTAAKIYGLDTVLKAVNETDETDRDARNPIASIYERIAPNPEEREHLFDEIDKEDTEEQKEERKDDEPEDINNAIHQMKVLLDAIQNDPRFANLRERAASEGKDVISYLTGDEANPTLTNFFNGLDAASGGSIDEILDEIEQEEAEKELQEMTDKISAGEELSFSEQQKAVEAAEVVQDTEINPEMLR